MAINELSRKIIGAAIEVHKELGPGLLIECGYRLDLVVEERIIVELKAISEILPVHKAQLLSYARLGKYPLGLLINFHEPLLKNGIHRLVSDRMPSLS